MKTIRVKLPRKHAEDWAHRCLDGDRTEQDVIKGLTARWITLELTRSEWVDLKDDAEYYASEMGPDNTGDIDYRPAARRCLAHLPEWPKED